MIEYNKEELYTKTCFFLIGIMISIFSIVIMSSILFCCSFGAIIIVALSRNDVIIDILSVLLLMTIIWGVYLGIFEFNFMPQAYALLIQNDSLFFWFLEGHFHAIRFLIAYPAYSISLFFDLKLDIAYGYYCAIIFSLIFSYLVAIKEKIENKNNNLYTNCLFYIFVLLLSIVMNGRICFAFLGFAILIYELDDIYFDVNQKNRKKRYINIPLGIILSTVSSGTMVVCVALLLIVFLKKAVDYYKKKKRNYKKIFIAMCIMLPIVVKGMGYVLQMINKNLLFYGGGFIGAVNMLQHGIGRIFGAPSGIMIVWLILMGVITIIINLMIIVHIKKSRYLVLIIGINISFYGLFVGFSTGSLMLVPICIVCIIGFERIIENGQVWYRA